MSPSSFVNKRRITKPKNHTIIDHLTNDQFNFKFHPLISTYENDLNDGVSLKYSKIKNSKESTLLASANFTKKEILETEQT